MQHRYNIAAIATAKTKAPRAINTAGRPSKFPGKPACKTSESNPKEPEFFASCNAIFSRISCGMKDMQWMMMFRG